MMLRNAIHGVANIADEILENGNYQMRTKSQVAWETAARCATLAQEADDPQEREHYARLRDAWITLAKRCEPFNFPDVADSKTSRDAGA
jgi:hypothetical protein